MTVLGGNVTVRATYKDKETPGALKYEDVYKRQSLYNETLRGCFTVGEKKKQKFFYINVKNIDVKK